MATESSAIVRFIDLAQQHSLPQGEPPRPEPRRRPRRPLEVAVVGLASILVGAVVVFGIFLVVAKKDGAADAAAPTAAKAAAAAQPALPAAQPALPPAQPALPAAQPAAAIGPEVVAASGFDIVVAPAGAQVILDGRRIGKAPLRVRNLLPGVHVVGVEGPPGYFGRHMQVTVQPGVAQRVDIALEPVPAAAAAPSAERAASAAPAAPSPAAATVAEADAERDPRERRSQRRRAARARSRAVARAEPAAASAVEPEPSAEAEPEPAAEVAGATGTLMIGTKPPCDISIDGQPTGLTTPQRDLQLSPGLHRVRLQNAALGIDETIRVRIEAGKTTRAIQDYTE